MMVLEDEEFQAVLEERTRQIEEILKRSLPRKDGMQKQVFDAMEYSLMAGGKRLRPMIAGEMYRLFGGGEPEAAEAFMAAIEMIHTYSLVHDDLPAMDNDDFRRGKATTHKVYGEDMGILAGDALLNFAYETALLGAQKAKNPGAAVRALSVLGRKAGVYGMVGGQVVDVALTGKPLSAEQLEFIYQLKTGALLEASFMLGAVLAEASDEDVIKTEQIGRNVGMAFQIQDDILDVTSTFEELGKPIGSDDKNEKKTYVSLYGMERAKEAVQRYSDQALELLGTLPGENAFLNTLIIKLIHRRK